MYITQPLLVKSENYTLMSLEVQSTFAPVVASCGINTVLSLLKNLDWPTLQQENIYWLKQVLMELSASVSLNINIWRKTKHHPVQLRMECLFQQNQTFFYLNELECRMLAPRLVFQKFLQAPRGNQFKIKGNVVNIPADVTNTVNILPQLPQESGTIKIHVKRQLEYESSALSLNVRLNKLLQAANWLATNSLMFALA